MSQFYYHCTDMKIIKQSFEIGNQSTQIRAHIYSDLYFGGLYHVSVCISKYFEIVQKEIQKVFSEQTELKY